LDVEKYRAVSFFEIAFFYFLTLSFDNKEISIFSIKIFLKKSKKIWPQNKPVLLLTSWLNQIV
jgi:hypothetical protein